MIQIKNLKVSYDKIEVLKGLNLKLEDNKIIAILGANGAGKSTLIKTIIGFLKQSAGDIFIDGKSIKSINFDKRLELISYVPQKMESGYRFLVKEFIELAQTKKSADIKTIMKEFKIDHLSNKYIDEISGGELRLVYLTRACYQNAKWLILDEPTSNLDYKNEHKFLELLNNLECRNKKSIILSIHNPHLALKYADEIIFLDNGRLIGHFEVKEKNMNIIADAFETIYGKEYANMIIKKE